eukprot:Hpha_TRINITY_DN3535_c0_g1::TRINITY_DN3535_c0_g1_i1::g.25698::m.25698
MDDLVVPPAPRRGAPVVSRRSESGSPSGGHDPWGAAAAGDMWRDPHRGPSGSLELPQAGGMRVVAAPCGGGGDGWVSTSSEDSAAFFTAPQAKKGAVPSPQRRHPSGGAGEVRSTHTLQVSPSGSPVSRPQTDDFPVPRHALKIPDDPSPGELEQVVGQLATLFRPHRSLAEGVGRREALARLGAMREEAEGRAQICLAAARSRVAEAEGTCEAHRAQASRWKGRAERAEQTCQDLRDQLRVSEGRLDDAKTRASTYELELEMLRASHRSVIKAAQGDSGSEFSEALQANEREVAELSRRARAAERGKGRLNAELEALRADRELARAELQSVRKESREVLLRGRPEDRQELERLREHVKELEEVEFERQLGTGGRSSPVEAKALRAAASALQAENDRLRGMLGGGPVLRAQPGGVSNVAVQEASPPGSPGSPRLTAMELRIAQLEQLLELAVSGGALRSPSPESPRTRDMERKIAGLEALVEKLAQGAVVNFGTQEPGEAVVSPPPPTPLSPPEHPSPLQHPSSHHPMFVQPPTDAGRVAASAEQKAREQLKMVADTLRLALGDAGESLSDPLDIVANAAAQLSEVRRAELRQQQEREASPAPPDDVARATSRLERLNVDMLNEELARLRSVLEVAVGARDHATARAEAAEKKVATLQAKVADKRRTIEQMRHLLQLHVAMQGGVKGNAVLKDQTEDTLARLLAIER